MTAKRLAYALLLSALLACLPLSCVAQGRQTIRGKISREGQPVAAQRFIISDAPNACRGRVAEALTDGSGEFEVSVPVRIGRFSVLVQHISLCQAPGDQPLWSETWGPAPSEIVLTCALEADEPCVAATSNVP